MTTKKNNICLTFDMDWAENSIIHEITEILIAKKIKSTWFITNEIPSLAIMRKYPDLFELGIHPNFYPGSTQGHSEEDILLNLKKMIPESVSVRSHGLYQNTRLFSKMVNLTGAKIDSSLCLPYVGNLDVHNFVFDSGPKGSILRAPFFWGDDIEMLSNNPDWEMKTTNLEKDGLKIFNFHPINLALNCKTYQDYNRFKNACSSLGRANVNIEKKINRGIGVRTIFLKLLEKYQQQFMKLKELIPSSMSEE
ncbi:MAG: hypothetical protein HQK52_05815 [Oligoflexia bacterium]|nr:hypothetical protein [Oligoflexia bacterium]